VKLTALKELSRPGPVDKPVTVAAGQDFEVADVSEAKGLIRAGLAKPAGDAAAKATPSPMPSAAAPAVKP
jgi:hypothetical protein